jgi:hypothetical protein
LGEKPKTVWGNHMSQDNPTVVIKKDFVAKIIATVADGVLKCAKSSYKAKPTPAEPGDQPAGGGGTATKLYDLMLYAVRIDRAAKTISGVIGDEVQLKLKSNNQILASAPVTDSIAEFKNLEIPLGDEIVAEISTLT